MHYLTTKTLCFVNDKGGENERMCYWWRRIHEVSSKEAGKNVLDLWRTNAQNVDLSKARYKFCSDVARFSVINKGETKVKGKPNFMEDLSDLLCTINDNDIHDRNDFDLFVSDCPEIQPEEYDVLKRRRARQMKGIIKEKSEEIGEEK